MPKSFTTGMVLNIQRYSLHDGPGIRTTVFLKGCSLRCKWCCNPEGLSPYQELAYNSNKCLGVTECGACLGICEENALYTLNSDNKVRVNWDLCVNCGKCVHECPCQALYLFGQEKTVDEVISEVEQDEVFYRDSGGGLRLSGGECLLQPDFAYELLVEAHRRGISTAIEMASNVPWNSMAKVLPHVDTVLHDIKIMDPVKHKKWTGAENGRILDNLKKAYETFPDEVFVARTPLIPGVNDSIQDIAAILKFILRFKNVIKYELEPYHRFGKSKYEFLGRMYELTDFESPSECTVKQLQGLIDDEFAKRER